MWEIPVDAVEWEDGMPCAPPAPTPATSKPMSLGEVAALAAHQTGGPIVGEGGNQRTPAPGPSFGTHIVDVEVEPSKPDASRAWSATPR